MPLFQNSVITKYLQAQIREKMALQWNVFKRYFHHPEIQQNIREAKEEQFQEGFIRELFVKILGYTLNPQPQYNLTTEYKNIKDSKKADGAIIINEAVKAVIELKATNTTDLGKVETQAFGYKNNQPDCVYVITSNFEKLRFYIDNAIEHIEFNLFALAEKDFELLWLCLAYENIEKGIAKKIKDESVGREDEITKQLYKDYSLFKRELHQNLVALNTGYGALELFKKSQKLLDRFLFLLFAEDRMLLPPNSVRLVLSDWKDLQERDVDIPLYDRFKKYFEYLNTGFKGQRYDVYAYNGGLFKPDAVLDAVKIDSELLYRHTHRLSEYDFVSEVDVNILGHIFENSLNELDEIKAQLEGKEIDKSKTKRKKDGVFYTPKYITKYIVDNTVGKLCSEKKAALQINEEEYTTDRRMQQKTKQALVDKLTEYRKWLMQLTICDPACGSGAFLNQALDFLIREHKYIDELQAKLFGDALVLSELENSILENNLFGVDLNEESVEIAKLSLWLRTAQPNRKLNDLNNNIKCGNSLIDDPAVAGDKAFNWQKEFPGVFEKGGFDVVIGNPPYVQHRKLFNISPYFKGVYDVYTGTSDLSVYFFEQGFNLLKNNGRLGFISTNKFFNTEYGKPLRKLLSNFGLHAIVNFEQIAIFQDALVSSVIIIGTNSNPFKNTIYVEFNKEKIDAKIFYTELINRQRNIENEYLANSAWIFENPKIKRVIEKIKKCGISFKDLPGVKINRGITTGFDDGFLVEQEKYNYLVSKDKANKEILKPLLRGKNIRRYYIEDSALWIINSHNGIRGKYARINLEKDYPNVFQHLVDINEKTNGKVEKRSDKGEHWTNLRNCAFLDEFEKEKVIWGLISGDWSFAYDNCNYYLTSASYFLTSEKIPVRFITAILNSRLSKFYFENIGEMTAGGAYVLKKVSVEKFIMPQFESALEFEIINKAITIEESIKSLKQIEISFLNHLKAKFDIEKFSNKLLHWFHLDSNDFLKEMKKMKLNINLLEEAEWLKYFNTQKDKAQNLNSEIEKTDKEIDRMVYELYGLTEEEVRIVEQNNN